MASTWTIRGALSPSAPLPCLAEELGADGVKRARVLGAFCATMSAPISGVIQPFAVLEGPVGRVTVWPYVDGVDLHGLLHASDLPEAELGAILLAVADAIDAAARAGRGLRVDRPAQVRVDRGGEVQVLASALSEAPVADAPLDALLDALDAAGRPATPSLRQAAVAGAAGLRAWLRDQGDQRGALARRVAAAGPTPLYPHAAAGQPWQDGSPSGPRGAPSPKATVARFGAFTLLLGLAVGWLWAPRGATGAVALHAPGAAQVVLTCLSYTASAVAGDRLWAPRGAGQCEIVWIDANGTRTSGAVRVSVTPDLICHRAEGAVTCEPR